MVWKRPSLGQSNFVRTDRPRGKPLIVTPGRGGVSSWAVPSRRERHADQVALRVRATLLLVGPALAALGRVHRGALGAATSALGVSMVVGAVAPGGGLWWRLALPSIAAFAIVVRALLTGIATFEAPAWIAHAIVLPIALGMSLEALRVDAVRRLPPAAGSRVGARERLELLRIPSWQRDLSMTFTCATAVLVFCFIAFWIV